MRGRPVALRAAAEVAAACGDDALVVWGAQGMRAGVRAWALGEAVAVACPDLNRRDRLTVRGEPAQVAALVRELLGEVGPSYRLLGERALVEQVTARLPAARVPASFEWMDTRRVAPAGPHRAGAAAHAGGGADPAGEAGWLHGADEEVTALLAEASPSAWAVPGVAGVRRWAGVRAAGGALVAVAADAWSCPGAGFVAGVATAPALRGRGYGERVCRFALEELAARYGRVALMVDTDNDRALALYERLGLRARPVAAAALDGGWGGWGGWPRTPSPGGCGPAAPDRAPPGGAAEPVTGAARGPGGKPDARPGPGRQSGRNDVQFHPWSGAFAGLLQRGGAAGRGRRAAQCGVDRRRVGGAGVRHRTLHRPRLGAARGAVHRPAPGHAGP
ncbi:hypothetical protein GCM10010517_44770 [Streptosporangium fragile]|uniref:N-acetyltransferase domain-containing protein n=1 Tax=Streptosporangium fragile TaxID=46186 RepID=A0ABP6IGS4_9ACTN